MKLNALVCLYGLFAITAVASAQEKFALKDGDRVVISASKQGLTFNGKLAVAA